MNSVCSAAKPSLLFIILLLCCELALAQHNQQEMPSNLREFDASVTQLPPHFAGTPIPPIWDALASRKNLQKSEFETQSQYSKRLEALYSEKVVGNISLGGTIALVVGCDHIDNSMECGSEYDAERGILRIESPICPDNGSCINAPDGFLVKSEWSSRRPAGMAQNGFGARFPVSTQSIVKYSIDADPPPWYLSKMTAKLPDGIVSTVELDVSPAEASAAKGKIREIIVGRLVPPFIGQEQDVSAATPGYPIESHMTLRTLHFEIKQVIFYNVITGKIYSKLGAD